METKRINRPVFDMLRTAAVIMVFTIHFLEHRNIPVPGFIFNFFRHCGSAVAFFFVISGYLIMQSLDNSKNTKEYFIKRVSRIVPAYFVVIILGIVVWDIILGQMPKDSLLHLGWIRYFLFLNSIVPSKEYYFWNNLWGLWTMSCFLLYYLLAPIIKKYVKNYKYSLVMLFFIFVFAYLFKAVYSRALISFGFSHFEYLAGDSAVFNLVHFALGTVAYYAVKEGKDQNYISLIVLLLAAVLLLREDTFNRFILSFLAVLFMIAMKDFEYNANTKWIGNVFSAISKYSFCIYLVHMFVLELTDILFSTHLDGFDQGPDYKGTYVGLYLAVTLAGSVFLAVLLHHGVEKPFAKLIKHIGSKEKCQK